MILFYVAYDGLIKSQIPDDSLAERSQAVKSSRCKARKYEGMRRTYWYAAMTEDAAQRSRWTFHEVVRIALTHLS